MLEHVERFENVNKKLLIKFRDNQAVQVAKYYVLRYLSC